MESTSNTHITSLEHTESNITFNEIKENAKDQSTMNIQNKNIGAK